MTARESSLTKAHADQKQAAAAVDSLRNQVDNQVWSVYSTTRAALGQQRAAAALPEAVIESCNPALESYNYGEKIDRHFGFDDGKATELIGLSEWQDDRRLGCSGIDLLRRLVGSRGAGGGR